MPHISSFAISYIDQSTFDMLLDTVKVVQFNYMDDTYEVSWDYKNHRILMYDTLMPKSLHYTIIHPDISQTSVTLDHILTAIGFGENYVVKVDLPVGKLSNVDNYLSTPIYDLPLSQFTISAF
jgi:hypothetical protein